jgi:hypothetical protein
MNGVEVHRQWWGPSSSLHVRERDGAVIFSVSAISDLTNVIIPHFVKYPLLTQKRADFLLFKLIVELMNK